VADDSQIFLSASTKQDDVKTFLSDNLGPLIPDNMLDLMAKDLSNRLADITGSDGSDGSDPVPDDTFT
jgi:hypothetical protein